MNQKKIKSNQIEKLKDQVEILRTCADLSGPSKESIELTIKAALILKNHYCQERTDVFKQAIYLCEFEGRFETVYMLAAIALKVNDDTKYFKTILEKYKGKKNAKPG